MTNEYYLLILLNKYMNESNIDNPEYSILYCQLRKSTKKEQLQAQIKDNQIHQVSFKDILQTFQNNMIKVFCQQSL